MASPGLARCARTSLALVGSLLWTAQPMGAAPSDSPAPSAAARANVVGSVWDEAGEPVPAARLELVDERGAVVARSRTGRAGRYRMECVDPGRYRLRLRPEAGGFRGETVVVPLDARGVRVEWRVAPTKTALALATATGGTCGAGVALASGAPVAPAAVGAGGADSAPGRGLPSQGTVAADTQLWARVSSILAATVLVGGVAAGVGAAGGGGGGGGGVVPQSPTQ